jgi:hypothetical protein
MPGHPSEGRFRPYNTYRLNLESRELAWEFVKTDFWFPTMRVHLAFNLGWEAHAKHMRLHTGLDHRKTYAGKFYTDEEIAAIRGDAYALGREQRGIDIETIKREAGLDGGVEMPFPYWLLDEMYKRED